MQQPGLQASSKLVEHLKNAVCSAAWTGSMPAGVEATLEQLDLSAEKQQSAGNSSGQNQQQGQHEQQHEQADAQDQEPPAALQNTACLAATFSCLEDEQSLVQCSAVCQLWNSVLQSDDIWRRVYLHSLPEPLPFERVRR
jgi:hypothetical protein